MKKFFTFANIAYTVLFCIAANAYLLIRKYPLMLLWILPFLLFLYIFADTRSLDTKRIRLKICYHGSVLLTIFALSLPVSVLYHTVLAFLYVPHDYMLLVWSGITCIVIEGILFWIGIICVYLSSVQLGIALRVKGLLCGLIPILNLIMLKRIIVITMNEVKFEIEKEKCNLARKDQQVCRTAYPILLVHGVFFRDSRLLNYWGRIPKELTDNGATVYYGEHQSARSVADSAKELAERIRYIVQTTGCEKVNIIAHSKGGLDSRYAISELGIAPYVASLTTINTPHRGCQFVDWVLKRAPEKLKNKIAQAYNETYWRLGDDDPSFMAAVSDLTAEACQSRNELLHLPEGIYTQSVGSVQKKARSGKFPLNISYHFVKIFDGANDGLVGESSFAWGEHYQLVTVKGDRGVSHADMVDLNRENLPEFDVREFYVQLVRDLKDRGL